MQRDERNLYPVGFMGSGKDKVGKILAAMMGRGFVTTDQMVERVEGKTIAEIFASFGEEYFRFLETRALVAVAGMSNMVVSAGGGAFCQRSDQNRTIMRESGIVVWLDVDLPILEKRLEKKADTRPLWAKRHTLFDERRRFYEQAHHRIHIAVEAPAEEVAERVLHAIGWK